MSFDAYMRNRCAADWWNVIYEYILKRLSYKSGRLSLDDISNSYGRKNPIIIFYGARCIL